MNCLRVRNLSEKRPKWLLYIEKDVIDIRDQIATIERRLVNLTRSNRELLRYNEKLITYLAITLSIVQVPRVKIEQLYKEWDEIIQLARRRGITPLEILKDLEKKGTLPPALKEIRENIKMIQV
jgi:hypothetical protein